MRTRSGIRLLAGVIMALPLLAQERPQNLQISAFGTLGVVGTDTHAVGFRRDASQPDSAGVIDKPRFDLDTRFGVQLSSKLGDHLLATIQAVSRYRYDGTFKPEVDWATLAWNPFSNFQVRAGILGLDVLPNGDYSNVGYTYLWVRPPVEAFGPLNLFRMKGVSASQIFALGSPGSLQVHGFYGRTMDRVPAGVLGAWDISGGKIWGGTLKLQSGALRGRVGYSYLQIPSNPPGAYQDLLDGLRGLGTILHDPKLGAAADTLTTKGDAIRSLQLGGAWEQGPWQVQGTYLHSASNNSFNHPTSNGGFVSVGYRLGNTVPYLMVARAVNQRVARPDLGSLGSLPPQFGPLVAVGQGVVASLDRVAKAKDVDQRTLSAGVRWDFAEKADLKFQIDQVRSHDAVGLLVNPDLFKPNGWNGRMTVFSVTLDFILGGGR